MKAFVRSAALIALASAAPAHAEAPPAASAAGSVEGIVVTANRPASQVLLDRKVFTVANDLQATSGTAADVLNKVPSVNVDADGAISVRGDGNVTILVDGKPSAQFTGAAQGLSLLQFPASDIDRVEVLTNPPAQYRAEGTGGVINIITRKTHRAGLTGTARASLGDKRRYVLGVDAAYSQGPLRLSGGLGLRQDAKERLTTSDRTALDPTTGALVRTRQSVDESFRRLIPSVKASADLDLNPKQTLGASFSHRELSGNRYFDQHDEEGPPLGAVSGISDRHSDGHEWSVDDSKALTFEQKLWRPNETLNLSLQRSANRERERYAYSNTFSLPAGSPTYDDLRLSHDLVKTEFAADYELPMSHDRDLKLGYDLEDDRNAFDNVGDNIDPVSGSAILNSAVTNHFRYHQQVNAAYADYQTPLGAWRLDSGLRLEATRVSTFQITGGVAGGWNETALYPSLHLERSLGEADKLTAAISRRVTRPDPESLNPFADYQDTHNLRAGNANLRPQDTWAYELGLIHSGSFNYGATAYYRSDRNSFTEIVQPISADVVLTTKANLPKRTSEGVEFNLGGKLWSALSYNLSGDIFHAQIDASSLGVAGLKSTSGVNLKANLDYRPTSADTLQVSLSRTDKRLTPQGYVDAMNLVNLGYKRDLRPDLSLVVTVTDLFDGQRVVRHVISPTLSEVYTRHQFGRLASVGVVYTFGGRKKGKSSFDYDE
ncbi:MAG: TonB-dependent receptor [Phenylobacterium sp.]|nr:TonB-dependent receptor [Phenylobacterium sp.]